MAQILLKPHFSFIFFGESFLKQGAFLKWGHGVYIVSLFTEIDTNGKINRPQVTLQMTCCLFSAFIVLFLW